MSVTDTAPKLSAAEWRSVASAFRAADQGRIASNPALEAVRQFAALTRRHRRPADGCRPALAHAGFNDRQIAALAFLSI